MNGEAPLLSGRDIADELRIIHQQRHRTRTTALYGRGERCAVELRIDDEPETFDVVPVRCELEMRRALAHAGNRPLVLLLDYLVDRFPADLEGRVARGKLFLVTDARRLARLFGASAVSAELLANRRLCQALLEDPTASYPEPTGSTVSLGAAWRQFLQQRAGLPLDGSLSEERVLEFCTISAPSPRYLSYISAREELRDELHRHLQEVSGPVARIAWRAWENEEGKKVAALALVLDVAARHVSRHGYLKARLIGILEALDPKLASIPKETPALLARWGALATPLMLRLHDRRAFAEAVVAEADALLPDADVEDVLAESGFLPRAFALAESQLAGLLDELAAAPSRERFAKATQVLRRMQTHYLAQDPRSTALIERTRMALRLVAYRLSRPDLAEHARGAAPAEEALLLAEHFAQQGSYVDRARKLARGAALDPLGHAIEKVVAAADAQRDKDDESFARGLASWIQARRKSDRVVPVDQALERLAGQFLDGAPHRKLLIALLDGMSWANAVELLDNLEGIRFAPIRWRPKGMSPSPQALLPPVLAALPTTTEVSRSALFAGRLMKPGEAVDTGKDPERLADHRGLGKIISHTPRLMLRGELTTPSGDLRKEAYALITSEDRLVAVVVNAMDEQLHGSSQVRVEYGLDSIKLLPDLLRGAAEARRAVLLIADHGHVPGARLRSVGARVAGSGSRWRVLAEGEEPGPNEVSPPGDAVWRPKDRQRIAMLYRETDSYGVPFGDGTHGGASLAEVVAPAVMIAAEDLGSQLRAEGTEDPVLDVTPFPRPPFWDLELRPPSEAAVPSPLLKEGPPPRQQVMPFMPPPEVKEPKPPRQVPVPVKPPKPAEISPWSAMLTSAKVFRDLPREKRQVLDSEIVPQVEVLMEHDGRMPSDLFARRAGLLPFRVPGAVSKLAEWLNLDSYPVIVHDKVAGQVRLDTELFKRLFAEET